MAKSCSNCAENIVCVAKEVLHADAQHCASWKEIFIVNGLIKLEQKDVEHLECIYERLLQKHSENENYDYMTKFKDIISKYKNTLSAN